MNDPYTRLDAELKNDCLALVHHGKLVEAQKRLDALAERANEYSELLGRVESLGGEVAGMLGHLQTAAQCFRRAIALLDVTDRIASLARARRAHAKVLLVLASADVARVELQKARSLCDMIDDPEKRLVALLETAILEGFIALSARDVDAAQDACRKAGGYWKEFSELGHVPFGREPLADLGPAASRAVTEGMLHQLVGLVQAEREETRAKGLEKLEYALNHFESHGLVYHHARALDAYGRAVAATQPYKGQDLVEQSRDLYIAMEAHFLAERAKDWIDQRKEIERSLGGTPLTSLARITLDPTAGVFCGIRIAGPATKRVVQQAIDAGTTPGSVLITGESGTGKELVVDAIHYSSPRAEAPVVKINCAAFTESLLESELFGHVKGAFSGAVVDKKGLFEEAHGGTIFLDEIGDTKPDFQVKLLRVIQEGEMRRVGGTGTIHVDVRVIAATNHDLERDIATGNFRQDLYYRLNATHIHLTPLCERPGEIGPLAEALVARIGRELDTDQAWIKGGAVLELKRHHWPGNVRELENVLRGALADAMRATGRPVITAECVSERLASRLREQASNPPSMDVPKLLHRLSECGWEYDGPTEYLYLPIMDHNGRLAEWVTWDRARTATLSGMAILALIEADGAVSEAAIRLDTTRQNLVGRLKQLGFRDLRRAASTGDAA